MEEKNTWEINGYSLPVDAEDAAFMERYQAASAAISNREFAAKNEAEAIRTYCENYRIFFDALFGDGTSEKLFANVPDNCRTYDDVFTSLLKTMFEQKISAKLRLTEAVKRYAPTDRLVQHSNG